MGTFKETAFVAEDFSRGEVTARHEETTCKEASGGFREKEEEEIVSDEIKSQ